MGMVTFVPKEGTEYRQGWPEKVVGKYESFIDLDLDHVERDDDFAMYEDQFGDEYEFVGKDDEDWTVEVRED